MVPAIGLIVACYVAVRMLQALLPADNRAGAILVKVAAGVTLLVALASIVALTAPGGTATR